MNAKQLAAVSALVLAGTASAQTVAAEAWVGPIIATTGGALNRSTVLTDLHQFRSRTQAAQEAWAGASGDAAIVAGAAKRSEVVADFRLYARAGLAALQSSEAYDPFSAQAQQRMAHYQRLRSGPEFAQEVQRIEGTQVQTAAHARAPWSSVD